MKEDSDKYVQLFNPQLNNSLRRYFKHVLNIKNVEPDVSESYCGNLTILNEIRSLKKFTTGDKKRKSFYLDALHNNEFLLGIQNRESLDNNVEHYTDLYEKFFSAIINKSITNIISFSINNLNKSSNRIYLINLDKESKDFWEKFFNKFIQLKSFKGFFIFYYLTDCKRKEELEDYRREVEYNRKSFGHSRFIRDYLFARDLAKEIAIYEDCNYSQIVAKIENIKTSNGLRIKPKKEFEKLWGQFEKSMKYLFKNIPFDKIFPEKNSIIHLYKFNKNKNAGEYGFESTDFYKENFGDIKNPLNTHETLRELDHLYSELIYEKGELVKENIFLAGKYTLLDNFRKALSSFLYAMIYYKEIENPVFLFLDDKPEYLIQKIRIIELWFTNPKIYFVETTLDQIKSNIEQLKKLKEVLNLKLVQYNKDHNDDFYKDTENFKEYEIFKKNDKSINNLLTNQVFVFIDLDFNGIINGFKLLYYLNNYLTHYRNKLKNIYPIIFSRFEDPYFIRKAINTGSLYYINKSRFFRVIYKLYQLEKRDTLGYQLNDFSSWNALNKIEPSLKIKLKNYHNRITGENVRAIYDNNEKQKNILYSDEYEWIKGLPKADLHIHIGTILSPKILPETAILVLYDLYRNKKITESTIYQIIKFLIPIAFDPHITGPEAISEDIDELKTYKITFSKDIKYSKSIFQIIDEEYQLIENGFIPEVVLLDPNDTTLERVVDSKKLDDDYFQLKFELRANKEVKYDIIMLVFIYLLAFRVKHFESDEIFNKLNNYLKDEILEIDPSVKVEDEIEKSLIEFCKQKINENVLSLLNKFGVTSSQDIKCNIIQFLQSARSKQRCGKEGSLFNYLRGCEYGGAPHLQSKLSIYYICKYIVNDYAIPENIRYLGLRCAVDGYSKFGLLSQETAVESLLRGFDFYSKRAFDEGKKVHVDIIITAKRHKSIKEFENNVNIALKYRHGLNIRVCEERKNNDSYFKSSSKVVSFDLAGNEKGNRVSKFYEQFYPLLKESFPITVHAGEEDDYESIWEAIFLINSHRIGHALTLGQNESLLDMVRDRHIAVELCPISNFLTRREKYELDQDKIRNAINNYCKESDRKTAAEILSHENIYPLLLYFNENINVTINTDNPAVSDSTLSEEYLFAAKMSGGLTKWDILKIIKNGYKNISIDKFQKEKLMREIEDEVFQYLTKRSFI